MSFFREPRAHVYSQFAQVVFAKMCTKTKLKPGDLMHVEFAKWVGYFYKGLQPNGSMTVTDSLGCYHPYNMQVRFRCAPVPSLTHTLSFTITYRVYTGESNEQTMHSINGLFSC